MRRGKSKRIRKYLSVILIPHSQSSVRVLRFRAFYLKIGAAFLFVAAVLVAAGLFISSTLDENCRLRQSIDELSAINAEQRNLLNEKAAQIENLKERDENISKQIKDFTDKYREMIENYLGNKTAGIKTDRSGSSTARSFMRDSAELKLALDILENAYGNNDEVYAGIRETENKLNEYIGTIPTLWPTSGRVSSPFGGRRDPFRYYSERFHTGIDIAADYGQPIRAAADGEVVSAQRVPVYGNQIVIDHGHGMTSMYGHTSKMLVKKGQKVKKGDLIARVGSSGRSTGSHLHFELRINGTPVDPIKYLEKN